MLGKLLHVCLAMMLLSRSVLKEISLFLPTLPQSEELQKVRGFLDRNQDLMESLRPQWQRLEAVQAQQGQQIDTLTGRMDNLEKQTAGNTDAGTGTVLGKSQIGWSVFEQRKAATTSCPSEARLMFIVKHKRD